MDKPATKTIKLACGTDAVLFLADHGFYACVSGHPVDEGSYYGVCPDCGAMFCETCMADGTFEDHCCEDGDD